MHYQNLHEWYHFVQEIHLINIPLVTSKKVGTDYEFPPFFQNGRLAKQIEITSILNLGSPRNFMLVSMPTY